MNIRLFGPLYEDVAESLREPILYGLVDRLWYAFPEVHINTDHKSVLQTLHGAFNKAIFTTTGEDFTLVVGNALRKRGLTLAIAESCTGGLVSDMVTDVPGASDYFILGMVSYSNRAKQQILGVDPAVLKKYGAVCEPVVRQMLTGVLDISGADCGIAISGIAGPAGGSVQKPVGTVFIAAGCQGKVRVERFGFGSVRRKNKVLSAYTALNMIRLMLQYKNKEN